MSWRSRLLPVTATTIEVDSFTKRGTEDLYIPSCQCQGCCCSGKDGWIAPSSNPPSLKLSSVATDWSSHNDPWYIHYQQSLLWSCTCTHGHPIQHHEDLRCGNHQGGSNVALVDRYVSMMDPGFSNILVLPLITTTKRYASTLPHCIWKLRHLKKLDQMLTVVMNSWFPCIHQVWLTKTIWI